MCSGPTPAFGYLGQRTPGGITVGNGFFLVDLAQLPSLDTIHCTVLSRDHSLFFYFAFACLIVRVAFPRFIGG